jgi:hypothetical protein
MCWGLYSCKVPLKMECDICIKVSFLKVTNYNCSNTGNPENHHASGKKNFFDVWLDALFVAILLEEE